MYFTAHHLLDVVVGGLLSLLTAVALDRGVGACAATPWHPIAALAAVKLIMKLLVAASATDAGSKHSKERCDPGAEKDPPGSE